jgi:hypothetical protein
MTYLGWAFTPSHYSSATGISRILSMPPQEFFYRIPLLSILYNKQSTHIDGNMNL